MNLSQGTTLTQLKPIVTIEQTYNLAIISVIRYKRKKGLREHFVKPMSLLGHTLKKE